MSAEKMLTVWLPVDPEYELERLRRYLSGSDLALIEDVEERLAKQGYRLNPRHAAQLKALAAKYEAKRDGIIDRIKAEHVGPPKGKVPPPGAAEYYQRTGYCMVTEDEADPPLEPRSRH